MKIRSLLALAALATLPAVGDAAVIYDTWTPAGGGNYHVTVNQGAGVFHVNVTVNPWNAEVLGLFIDWGNVNLTNTTVSGSNVSRYAYDTSSDSCGQGCNLNGSGPGTSAPNDGWEWVLRLGTQGFNNIQTFQFTLADNGFGESVWGQIGIRAQQLCSGDDTLPEDKKQCNGSEKVLGSPSAPPTDVPEPATLGLLGLGLAGLALANRRRRTAA